MQRAELTHINHQPLILAPEVIGWREHRLPLEPAPGRVRIRTRTSLISPGTEMCLFHGAAMSAAVWDGMCDLERFKPGGELKRSGLDAADAARFPCSIGYNNIGEVVAIGEGSEGLRLGDRVFTQARHCELFDIEPWEGVLIPEEMSDAAAAPAYLATLGLHALRRTKWMPGEAVVVVGLGIIGLTAALVADAVGAELILIGRSEPRTRVAEMLFPKALVHHPDEPWAHFKQKLDGLAPQVAIEAAGSPDALRLSLSVLGRAGRLTALGMHGGSVGALLSEEFYAREISIVGSSNDPYGPPRSDAGFTTLGNVTYVFDLISRGRLSLEAVCSKTFPAAQVGEAYAQIATGEHSDMIGVLLDWRGQSWPAVEPGL